MPHLELDRPVVFFDLAEGLIPFKWFSSGGSGAPVEPVRGLQAGDSFSFLFTVKKHDVYKGLESTVITRAGVMKDAADFNMKWVHPMTGEVFKTKKELAAASAV